MSKIEREHLEKMRKDELVSKLLEAETKLSHYEETYLTREEAAHRLKKSKGWIDLCRASGKIRGLKHDPDKRNSAIVFPLSSLVEYEQTHLR